MVFRVSGLAVLASFPFSWVLVFFPVCPLTCVFILSKLEITTRAPSFGQGSEEGEGVWIIIHYNLSGLVSWLTLKILALGSWRQEDCHGFDLGYRTDKTKEFLPCSQSYS